MDLSIVKQLRSLTDALLCFIVLLYKGLVFTKVIKRQSYLFISFDECSIVYSKTSENKVKNLFLL